MRKGDLGSGAESSSDWERRIHHGVFFKTGGISSVEFKQVLGCVIPAWSAGIQVDMDVSGSILASLDAGYPCRHDGV
jgi:hypothetical protein